MGLTQPIGVLIVDDHELVRIGLHSALNRIPGIKVVGVAVDGESAVNMAVSLRPNVVLMDIGLPVFDGIEASRRIKEQCPDIRILILTAYERQQHVIAAFAAGADGYCLKAAAANSLADAIQAVHRGEAWLDPAVADAVLRPHPAVAAPPAAEQPKPTPLSRREHQVLLLMVDGLTNPEIAQRLGLSSETVKTHVQHVLEKLAVSDRTQAAVKALRLGLLDKRP